MARFAVLISVSDFGLLSTLRSIGIDLLLVTAAIASFKANPAFAAATEDGSAFGFRPSGFVR